MHGHEPDKTDAMPSKIQFDYTKYSRLMSDMDLEVFFAHNSIPFLGPLPPLLSIKSRYMAMNERLYKRAKELEEIRRRDPSYVPHNKIRRRYLDAFDSKKMASPKLQRRVRRNIKMYVQSQVLIHLFRGIYSLFDYHHGACVSYPILAREYMKTVCMVFASAKKSAIVEMLNEISTSAKMYSFFKDLYHVWENEAAIEEKDCIIRKFF